MVDAVLDIPIEVRHPPLDRGSDLLHRPAARVVEAKMAVVNRSVTFSEFLARILDHHLLPSKRR